MNCSALQVVLVYRSGGEFTEDDVKVITRALRTNGGFTGRIKCLTDVPRKVEPFAEPVQLQHQEWWGWWSKIERYKPGLFAGPVLYFDLDTAIFGDIEPLLNLVKTSYQPMMLESRKHPGQLATGIVSWWGYQMEDVYNQFIKDPHGYINEHNKMELGNKGPQGFVRRVMNPPKLQHFLPSGFIQFKKDFVKTDNPDCTIVAWSGRPRMSNSQDPRIAEYWERFSS